MPDASYSTLRSPERFRKQLSRKGLSTRKLAEIITKNGYAVSHSRVGHLRMGDFPNVQRELAERIELALGCMSGELFRHDAYVPKSQWRRSSSA